MSLGLLRIYGRCCGTAARAPTTGTGRQVQTRARPSVAVKQEDVVPVFRRAADFPDRTALLDVRGNFTYATLFAYARELALRLQRQHAPAIGDRILFLTPNDATHVVAQWAIWMAGCVAVPLAHSSPPAMFEYYCRDAGAKLIVCTPEHQETMHRVAASCRRPLLVIDGDLEERGVPKEAADMEDGMSPQFYNKKGALIIYTSGTTGSPKGVVLSHKNLVSQVSCLVDAWKWSKEDAILHTLPLNHVHGIVNALLCPLYVGAKCHMMAKFDAYDVWSALLGLNTVPVSRRITVFMAVPTIYSKLCTVYDEVFSKDPKMAERIKTTLKSKFRLMVSGSAPLPVRLHERWLEITGHRLLERYGMTEIGMCLSHELASDREPGYVGVPLPGVSVKIGRKPEEDEGNYDSILEATNKAGTVHVFKDKVLAGDRVEGELLVKGDNVFGGYFNRPKETAKEFTIDGWFKTGDVCQYSEEKRLFKILGRKSVDIIKTGGYKVSALEVEAHLLDHPSVEECAVIGKPHEYWGQMVVAVVKLGPDKALSVEDLKDWASRRIPEYAVPKELFTVQEIQKNHMGKVNKKDLLKQLCSD